MSPAKTFKADVPVSSHLLFRYFLMGTAQGIGFWLGSALVLAIIGFILQNLLSEIPFFSDVATALNTWIQSNSHR